MNHLTIYHNSRDLNYRKPFGAVPTGSAVTLCVSCLPGVKSVALRLWIDGREEFAPMSLKYYENGRAYFEAIITMPKDAMLVWYYFVADGNIFCGAPYDNLGGESVISNDNPNSFQITVYESDFAPPKWLAEGIMYQIFPDRFFDGDEEGRLKHARNDIILHEDMAEPPYYVIHPNGDVDNNDFYGGNLIGIEKKLDYLKSLGVTALYLNPIFKAHSNHKYDTGDYSQIDPMFGDDDAFKSLCAAAKQAGIRVMLDGVFSHTGSDSLYFNKNGTYPGVGAYQSKSSIYYSWYNFEKFPDEYDCWWGVKILPAVNELDPSYMNYIVNGEDAIVKKWLSLGASGWRLDVADELPDGFLDALYLHAKKTDSDSAVIGEVWEDASNKISYGNLRRFALGRQMDSVMNYPLRDALIAFFLGEGDSALLKRRIDSLKENYPRPFFYSLMNLMGTHDRSRIINILSEYDLAHLPKLSQRGNSIPADKLAIGIKRLKLMSGAIFYLPGMPTVYYGDEAGLEGMSDPFNRAFYPWDRENTELMEHFKNISHARKDNPVLVHGELALYAPHPDVLAIARTLENNSVTLVINRSEAPVTVLLPCGGMPVTIAPLSQTIL